METKIKSPSECTDSEIDVFVRLTIEGGQVSPNNLTTKVKRAEKLVFIWEGGVCVAIAGLKNPADTYRNRVFAKAKVEDQKNDYKYEIGYIYSKIKGVGNELMEAVLKASNSASLFATTKNTNNVMQYLLPKYGFERLGQSYLNDTEEYHLGLFGLKI
ncbi:hypothetical protein AYY19_13180 [Photobacterium aquimaris]|uniref:hypothetical protein n=1 Tax=Photobacterium aquimaris TaxID=512643 RepID=UPI0007EF89D3|nr:hypothetical protein [Photobacterium aquimaris]OBU17602.1 hypothetical protein AYY19_13180 [Photobacterium aquimaris]PSV98861.1 N-acetyltransferase [Photobacterium aquimaris]